MPLAKLKSVVAGRKSLLVRGATGDYCNIPDPMSLTSETATDGGDGAFVRTDNRVRDLLSFRYSVCERGQYVCGSLTHPRRVGIGYEQPNEYIR